MKFKRGDMVIKKDEVNGFWMTVTSATASRVYCNFGASKNYAGSFANTEVVLYQNQNKK